MGNNGLSIPQEFRGRFERFSVMEQEREDAIDQLLDELDRLRDLAQVTSDDLDREKMVCRSLQEDVRKLKATTERRGFVAVLIDADSDDYLFREHFLKNGLEGGKDAANELYAGIVDYLKGIKIDAENLDVVVRAFANFSGLQSGCVKKGLLQPEARFSPFAQGFTQRRGLFDFVDVGRGKEMADFKIKESLNLFVNDYQCKHIIVGACQDAGYAPYLSNFASDPVIRDKFSLLEGGTMHSSFKNLGFPRKPFKMEKVFALQPSSVNFWSGIRIHTSTLGPEPAASSNLQAQKRPQIFVNDKAKTFADKLKPVRDSEGKRVDKKLKVDPDSEHVKAMKGANFCGFYYLRGQCDGKCLKNHAARPLTSHEFDCLWYILRQSGQCYKFRKGKDCEDPLCFYGHQNPPQ